ncbi:MAG TPA: glycosyltransferase family 39 protein [Pyrinomonadaceae bacterium]|nr:glycosyltransferase family 39 protein [Pyrinomonadaceae bacterium]
MKNGHLVKQMVLAGAAIFIVAFGVRLLSWHDTRREVGKVQTVVAADYQNAARLFRQHGAAAFFSSTGPLADPNLLGHPPGYPILIAIVWTVFGESNASIQLLQVVCDALAAVLIFLIAIELFPFAVGLISGLLVALAPQFSWNSVLLLPDTLAVFPVILAVYFLTCAWKKPWLVWLILAGVCLGLSCWLRANALFMAPFLVVFIVFLFDRKQRLHYAGAFLAGAVLVIAPLTIRNWIVFHHFIPVSLGAGQTMLEGISDYDPDRRFGIPQTDMGIMKMEAEENGRPDYYSTLFAPDGIKRDRLRVARGMRIIRNNPGWFLGVMVQRAGSMLRLERARRISTDPPVRQYGELTELDLKWRSSSAVLSNTAERFPNVRVEMLDASTLQVISNAPHNAVQLRTAPVEVRSDHDYVLRMNLVVEDGRFALHVVGAGSGNVLSSTIIEKAEIKEGQPPPVQVAEIPFVSGNHGAVQLALYNAAATSETSIVNIRNTELFELGAASFGWTRPLRWIVNALQNLFITAVMLPLSLFGMVILIRRRAWQPLLLLLSVPAYYFCFQSLLHTEYRYVLAVHYFLFVLVSVAVYELWTLVLRLIQRRFSGKATAM